MFLATTADVKIINHYLQVTDNFDQFLYQLYQFTFFVWDDVSMLENVTIED